MGKTRQHAPPHTPAGPAKRPSGRAPRPSSALVQPHAWPNAGLLALHQQAGNQAVSDLLQPAVQREAATAEGGAEKEREARQTLGGIKIDQKIPPKGLMHSKKIAAGPFWIEGIADLNVAGTLKWGEGGVVGLGMTAEEGKTNLESEFSTEAETKYGKIEAGAGAGSLSVGFAGRNFGVSFKVNASLTHPLEAKFKIDIPVHDEQFGRFKFTGTLTGSVTLVLSPNFEYIAEKAAERVASAAAEEAVTVAMEGGESVVATTAGAAAFAGAAAGAGAAAMELAVLYAIGRANIEGAREGIRHSYCHGFAETLSMFTEPLDQAHPVRAYNKGEEHLLKWAAGMDWRGQLQRAEVLSIEAENGKDKSAASYHAWWAGKAAVTQMVLDYIGKNGTASWKMVITFHQMAFGTSREARENAYYRVLRSDEGDDPPMIRI